MKRWLIFLALLLASGAVYFWFLQNFEKQISRDYVGYQGEARFNDLLAAELLLLELGIETESQQRLRPSNWLPPETDTLVTRLGPEIATESESASIMSWVRRGGHLVLLPPLNETHDIATFLESIKVRIVSPAFEDETTEEDEDDIDSGNLDGHDYVVDLDYIYRRIELLDEQHRGATLSDDAGVIAARSQIGSGYVTVYAGDYWFRNDSLANQDHARLFLDSVAGFVDPGKVWLFYDAEFTPLWRLIWNAAMYLVLSLVLAFIIWLWSRMPRFGPLLADSSGDRRSIGEHVSAAGRFVWQNNASSSLVEASVAAIVRKAERRHPGVGRLAREKQAIALGKLTEENPQDILQALMLDADDRPREFAQHIRLLQKIRNKL